MLADGQLTELIEQQRSQAPSGGRRDSRNRRSDDDRGSRGSKPDPFARPSKPKPEPEAVPEAAPDSEPQPEPTPEQDATPTDTTPTDATTTDATAADSSSEETSKPTADPEA
jgi:hypothetical protein